MVFDSSEVAAIKSAGTGLIAGLGGDIKRNPAVRKQLLLQLQSGSIAEGDFQSDTISHQASSIAQHNSQSESLEFLVTAINKLDEVPAIDLAQLSDPGDAKNAKNAQAFCEYAQFVEQIEGHLENLQEGGDMKGVVANIVEQLSEKVSDKVTQAQQQLEGIKEGTVDKLRNFFEGQKQQAKSSIIPKVVATAVGAVTAAFTGPAAPILAPLASAASGYCAKKLMEKASSSKSQAGEASTVAIDKDSVLGKISGVVAKFKESFEAGVAPVKAGTPGPNPHTPEGGSLKVNANYKGQS